MSKRPFGKKRPKKEEAWRQRTKRLSVAEGSATSVMQNAGQSFIAPFAIALGATAAQVGLLLSFPAFVGAVGQLLSTRVLLWYRSRVRLLSRWSAIQGFFWLLPLLVAIAFPSPEMVWVIVAWFAIYHFLGAVSVPTLQSLLGDVVEKESRGTYFGMRNAVVGMFGFASLLAAGFLLNFLPAQYTYLAFALLFFVALCSRLMAARMLSSHVDPPFSLPTKSSFDFLRFLRRVPSTNFGIFVLFMSLFSFSISISSPFFPYWTLRVLDIGYFAYSLLLAFAVVAGILTVRYWGKLADRFGNARILVFAAALIPLSPLLWMLGVWHILFLFAAKILSGFAWAGFSLSATNFIYDSSKPHERTQVFAYYALFAGAGVFAGGSLGSALLTVLPETLFGFSSIPVVFALSAVLSTFFVFYFRRRIREVVFKREVSEGALFNTVFSTELFYEVREGLTSLTWFLRKRR